MAKSFTILIFALIFVVNICAQSPKENRVVVIDEYVFGDQKAGISELIWAYNRIETEFSAEIKALNSMASEIAEKDKELIIRTTPVGGCVGSVSDLLNEREKLWQEHKQKIEDAKRRYDKRSSEIISPVLAKVELALKEFEKVKGYKVIKRDSLPQIVCADPNLDKTAEFIEFYNNRALVR